MEFTMRKDVNTGMPGVWIGEVNRVTGEVQSIYHTILITNEAQKVISALPTRAGHVCFSWHTELEEIGYPRVVSGVNEGYTRYQVLGPTPIQFSWVNLTSKSKPEGLGQGGSADGGVSNGLAIRMGVGLGIAASSPFGSVGLSLGSNLTAGVNVDFTPAARQFASKIRNFFKQDQPQQGPPPLDTQTNLSPVIHRVGESLIKPPLPGGGWASYETGTVPGSPGSGGGGSASETYLSGIDSSLKKMSDQIGTMTSLANDLLEYTTDPVKQAKQVDFLGLLADGVQIMSQFMGSTSSNPVSLALSAISQISDVAQKAGAIADAMGEFSDLIDGMIGGPTSELEDEAMRRIDVLLKYKDQSISEILYNLPDRLEKTFDRYFLVESEGGVAEAKIRPGLLSSSDPLIWTGEPYGIYDEI